MNTSEREMKLAAEWNDKLQSEVRRSQNRYAGLTVVAVILLGVAMWLNWSLLVVTALGSGALAILHWLDAID